MNHLHKQLGNKVRNYRLSSNLKTQELAEQLDISTGLLNNIENARYDVFKLELLAKIASRFGLTIDELLRSQQNETNFLSSYSLDNISIPLNLNNINQEEANKSMNFVKYIIQIYLELINEYKDNPQSVDYLHKHIINEMQFLKNLKQKMMLK